MTNNLFPHVPDALLAELEQRFPERSARPGETIEDLFYQGGQRAVIRFLKAQHDIQSQDPLGVKVT